MHTERACRGGTGWRRGQALMELAVGMFALALVVSALCGFALYIVKSLRVQNSLRSSAPQPSGEKIELGGILEQVTARKHLIVEEKVVLPSTGVEK